MAVERTVLVVAPTSSVAQAAAGSARRSGYRVVVVKSYADAKKQLTSAHLVVTELKLGEYNGLHLALRAAADEIPAIVVADSSFEQEVEQLGAMWMSPEAAGGDTLQAAMLRMLQGAGASRTALGWIDSDGVDAPADRQWESPSPQILH